MGEIAGNVLAADWITGMKDIGQPVMYQGPEEYRVWFRQAYDQYGNLIKTLGIETK